VAASPSALAWNKLATARTGGVELGDHQQQHREGGPQPQAAGDQAHIKVTATSAVESVAARSRTTPERNDRRSVPMVVRRYRSVTSRIPASWALPRLKARRLGRPRTTSRNQPDSPPGPRSSPAPGHRPTARWGHEHRDHRQGHGHEQRRGAVDGGPAQHGHRDHHREDHLGR